ncbi:type IX secretion system sortase PorU [Rubrivirga litoralis]|uniref:Type IX secretion system sortase PorU n=1 Tax=Rubrivirga litoralis TaxID=3075598 RepID=A0ABU3BMH9_9BACT|nr:type IX secretion system sortase PorU [Rubrivirga sp. F394]MDT0630488.1 type IX secretion system sortase PorU [Rubrivirga sp. F394]
MPRLVALCALFVAVSAAAQTGQTYRAAEPDGARLRVVAEDAASLTVEVTADWAAPLAEVVGRGGSPASLALLAAAGRPVLTHGVDLMTAAPPPATVVAFEGEEVRLDAATAEALAGLAQPAAEVVNVGRYRRRLVGTLAVAVLRVEGDRLIRTRRAVVRVPRPPVTAALAAARVGGAAPVTRSVLDEGTWFKIPVSQAGVYRIDAAYLRDGLGVENADLARVQVYGTGARILPAPNAAPRPRDLLEVPTLAEGGAVLFYAEGPTFADAPSWWDWVPATATEAGYWSHDISPFSRVSYYFVRVDAPAPRRLGAAAFPDWPDAAPLATVADRVFYEEDVTNWERDESGSGLDWLGPDFAQAGGQITVLQGVDPPGLGAARVSYRARVAARANPPVTITASVDGQAVATARPRRVFDLTASAERNLIEDAFMDWSVESPSSLAVTLAKAGGNAGAFAWPDWVEAVVERAPVAAGGALAFPTPGGRAGRFEVALQGFASEPEVWDVTAPDAVRRLGVRAAAGAWRVQVEATDPDRPRELYAFTAGAVRTPAGLAGGAVAVPNQNLHGVTGAPAYVVVAHPAFLDPARRLAERRRTRDGLEPVVVTTDQVYNEFAGGAPDMRAVRDYMKFLYDRVPAESAPRYLLLFGDGHYDFRGLKSPAPNYVLPYETENMFSRTDSYTSDDYFGLLDDDEGDWENDRSGRQMLDVGVGRLPVRTAQDAAAVVNKIVRYEDPATFGPWRGEFTFVADDQFPNPWDTDLHVLNADVTAEQTQARDSSVTLAKIYGPSYPLTRTARGARRPQMNEAIEEAVNRGTLVWNYSGHGSPDKLGDENYLTREMVERFDNPDRLPVFVTVTCSVGKFDIPDQQSLAEQILLRPDGGGVAMLTTVRLVYTNTDPGPDNNFGLNIELSRQMVAREPDGRPARLGDALVRTKRALVTGSINPRKFNLLGDPALRLGLPERRLDVAAPPVLTAFERATVSGRVLGPDGAPDPTFAGEVDVTVYDAARVVDLPEDTCARRTGGRCYTDSDDEGVRGEYVDQTARIYAGRARVEGGAFSTEFLVPQDVSYSGLPARVVAYAAGAAADGSGVTERPRVSAEAGTRPDDGAGPEIRLFVGDSTFVDGGEAPRGAPLVARLSDPSGINTVGAGVGHELLLTIDGDAASAVDVGRFYQGDLGTFRSGTVRAPLPDLAPGEHTLQLTAWDALNNASTAEIRVVVVEEELAVENVFPYPNPTAGPTRFTFEHNQPAGTPAELQVRIYTVAGRPVRTIDGDEALPGGVLVGRTVQVPWDGLDDDRDRLATGVYLFRLRLAAGDAAGGSRVVERVERLAIIR